MKPVIVGEVQKKERDCAVSQKYPLHLGCCNISSFPTMDGNDFTVTEGVHHTLHRHEESENQQADFLWASETFCFIFATQSLSNLLKHLPANRQDITYPHHIMTFIKQHYSLKLSTDQINGWTMKNTHLDFDIFGLKDLEDFTVKWQKSLLFSVPRPEICKARHERPRRQNSAYNLDLICQIAAEQLFKPAFICLISESKLVLKFHSNLQKDCQLLK